MRTLNQSNSEHITDLVVMIERRAPLFMSAGGIADEREGAPPLSPEKVAEILAELRTGKSYREIADKLGVSASCVAARARRHGLRK